MKRRSGSASQSNESWDDGEGRYNLSLDTKEEGDLEDREEGDEQPWGMPQDEYKALNPRDKKQVRNRSALVSSKALIDLNETVGSEHVGSEQNEKVRWHSIHLLHGPTTDDQTDYVSTLEGSLRVRDDEVHSLRSQLESYRNEINDLRTRLSMPLLPPPPPDTGLMGARGSAEGWDGGGEDRKDI